MGECGLQKESEGRQAQAESQKGRATRRKSPSSSPVKDSSTTQVILIGSHWGRKSKSPPRRPSPAFALLHHEVTSDQCLDCPSQFLCACPHFTSHSHSHGTILHCTSHFTLHISRRRSNTSSPSCLAQQPRLCSSLLTLTTRQLPTSVRIPPRLPPILALGPPCAASSLGLRGVPNGHSALCPPSSRNPPSQPSLPSLHQDTANCRER